MPTCDPLILTPACSAIIMLKPRSVLDVGIGLGKWGLLVREYADVWEKHRLYKDDWKTELLGIEVHERYENPVWSVYDRVIRGNAVELAKTMDWEKSFFDLGIMIDVIEHIEKAAATEFLAWLMTKCRHALVSYSNHDQKDVGDNPHEDHVSKWSFADFRPYRPKLLAGNEQCGWGVFLLSQ